MIWINIFDVCGDWKTSQDYLSYWLMRYCFLCFLILATSPRNNLQPLQSLSPLHWVKPHYVIDYKPRWELKNLSTIFFYRIIRRGCYLLVLNLKFRISEFDCLYVIGHSMVACTKSNAFYSLFELMYLMFVGIGKPFKIIFLMVLIN